MIDEKEEILQPEPPEDLTDEQIEQNLEVDIQKEMNRAFESLMGPSVDAEASVDDLNKAKHENEDSAQPNLSIGPDRFREEQIRRAERFVENRRADAQNTAMGATESADDGYHSMLEDRSGEQGYHEFGEDRNEEEGFHGIDEDRSAEKGYHGIDEDRSAEPGYHEFGEDRTSDAHFRGMGESATLTEQERAQIERENRAATEHNLRERIKAFRATGWSRAANEAANDLRALNRPDGSKDGVPQKQDSFIADAGDSKVDVDLGYDFRYDGKIFNATSIFDVNFNDTEKGAEHLWIEVPYTATSWSNITVHSTEFTETEQPDDTEYVPIVEGGLLVQNSHLHIPQL